MSITMEELFREDVLDAVDIARVAHATTRSVGRWQARKVVPRRDTEERLEELAAVLELARKVMTPAAARTWLRRPNPALGYDKPLDLIGAGDFRKVVASLLALGEGVTS